MSLRGFHIIFIIFAALCDGWFWLWTHTNEEEAAYLGVKGLGAFSGWVAIGIIIYGLWFVLRKARKIIV